jgi:hypothetical protein
MAADRLPLLKAEARERQLATLKQNTVPSNLTERNTENNGESRDAAARLFNTSAGYISYAKRLRNLNRAYSNNSARSAAGNFSASSISSLRVSSLAAGGRMPASLNSFSVGSFKADATLWQKLTLAARSPETVREIID